MSYTSKQTAQESHAAEQQSARLTAQRFSDQRLSTSVQLKQQQMMSAVQRMSTEEEEPLQGKFATAQLAEEEELLQRKFATTQRAAMEEEEPVQGKFETLQRAGAEEEEPLQGKFTSTAPTQLEQKPNNTGLPDNLKSGIENMSGYSMDDVKVHYNSDKPAQLNAHAYAQGTDIHVAPGQEQHLPHEAWHVVQQKQGRVQPTMQMKAGVPVNDDTGLEHEADVMGARAAQLHSHQSDIKNYPAISNVNIVPAVQRKIFFMSDASEITRPGNRIESDKRKKILTTLLADDFAKSEMLYYKGKFAPEDEFKKAIEDSLSGTNYSLLVENKDTDSPSFLNKASFIINATKDLGPNPKNFKIKAPAPGEIGVKPLNSKFAFKYVPEKTDSKTPGYVANIASYYAESGVKKITKKYFDEAISGSEDTKANKLAITIGLNSFSPVVRDDYEDRQKKVAAAVNSLELPSYPINFRGFGFLWEPNWTFKDQHIEISDLRHALSFSSDAGNRKAEFNKIQATLSENYPYGVFRETVMGSDHTQNLVDRLKLYNNPVYIHSGDGDAVGLKVTNDDDTGVADKGVLDKFSEHLASKGTGAKIVIGGYNLYNLNEKLLLTEIVKADSRFKFYKDGNAIDNKKPSATLADYRDEDQPLLRQKIAQIEHNSQVGNRYDRIIRDAISDIYPKMLYPTEPNMLIKAHDTNDGTDFFNTSLFENKKLKEQGSLWGVGASEGRIFKENLEKEYNETDGNGKGFVDWAQGASLPTDPRGFARHLLISGYEKFPDNKSDWPPFAEYEKTKENTNIPLTEAAVQQAQSYTSAYRLAELYAQASVATGLGKNERRKAIEGIRNKAKVSFTSVENMVKSMMDGSANLLALQSSAEATTGSELHDRIAKRIREELLRKYKFYNNIL